jgi:hypothetical protein
MTNTGSFIDDLADIIANNDLDAPSANPHKEIARANDAAKPENTFACESCGGTGRYRGVRLHQPETRCFACNGRGWFKKSRQDRMAARQQSKVRKNAKLDLLKADFNTAYPGLIAAATPLGSWNNFVRDLIAKYEQYGSLSEKQATALQNQIEKAAARDAERNRQRAEQAAKSVVDPSAIRDMFAVAHKNGLKKPGLWFGDIKISEAPANGVNAGALYVKRNGQYAGKIVGNVFKTVYGTPDSILADLLKIAADPATILREKGKQTGVCCCCGRELSDPESIKAGIGPTCASKWEL